MSKVALIFAGALLVAATPAQHPPMSFFITSVGPGNGADLGGLAGADRHCHRLAAAVGAGNRTWLAYLSTTASVAGGATVHARERIGTGPWYNAKGVMVAKDAKHLHGEDNNLSKETALNEKGEMVNGRGDSPNMHDILTGSNLDGTAYTAEGYNNCGNWTSSDTTGAARVGHHDRTGLGPTATSWNSAHNSRGCRQENLQATGGNGLFYCFALAL